MCVIFWVYNKTMRIEFDPNKSMDNERQRGLPFTLVSGFDWDGALVAEDLRGPYPERRFQATGMIAYRLYVVIFTPLADGIRVISFRKANFREVKRHGVAETKRTG